MSKFFLPALALFFSLGVNYAQADIVAGVRSSDRDYLLEGTVQTIWDDSFLLDDGTGTITVDVRPYTSFDLGLKPRDSVTVLGRLMGTSSTKTIKPLMVTLADGHTQSFGPQATSESNGMLDPKVMENTRRYGVAIAPEAAPQAAQAPKSSQVAAAAGAAQAEIGAPVGGPPSIPKEIEERASTVNVQQVQSPGALK